MFLLGISIETSKGSGRRRVSIKGEYKEWSDIKREMGIMEHEGLNGLGDEKQDKGENMWINN